MRRITALGFAAVCLSASAAQAAITRLEIVKVEPAFGGRSFGAAGMFERVIAKAHGELDPSSPANASIQDIALAPRNARGRVEYVSDVEIVRPSDRSKSNGVLFFNITNLFNRDPILLPEGGLSANPTFSDILGRAFRVGVRFRTK